MTKKAEVKLNDKQAKIWDHIKDKQVGFYGLKNVTVDAICSPLSIDPECLFLDLKAPVAISSLDELLAEDMVEGYAGGKVVRYLIERKDRFAVIKENPDAKK